MLLLLLLTLLLLLLLLLPLPWPLPTRRTVPGTGGGLPVSLASEIAEREAGVAMPPLARAGGRGGGTGGMFSALPHPWFFMNGKACDRAMIASEKRRRQWASGLRCHLIGLSTNVLKGDTEES